MYMKLHTLVLIILVPLILVASVKVFNVNADSLFINIMLIVEALIIGAALGIMEMIHKDP